MQLKKKDIFVLAALLIGLIGLVVIFIQVPPWQVIKTFQHVKPQYILLFFFSSSMIMLTFSFRWMVILRAQGHRVPVFTLMRYRMCAYGIGVLTPTAKIGGEPARMMLLKRNDVPMRDAMSSVLTDKIVEISTNFIFFMTGLVIMIIKLAIPEDTKIFIIVTAVVLASIIFIFYYQMLRGRFFFAKIYTHLRLHRLKRLAGYEFKIKEMERIMIRYHSEKRRNFYAIIFISLLGWIFTFSELYSFFKIIGIGHVTISMLFVTISTVGIAFLIPIPLAIGSLEVIQITSFALMGFSSAQAVALSFLLRSNDLFWTLLSLYLISRYGLDFVHVFRKSLVRVDEEITKVKIGEGEIAIRKKKNKEQPRESRMKRWLREKKQHFSERRAKWKERQEQKKVKEHMLRIRK